MLQNVTWRMIEVINKITWNLCCGSSAAWSQGRGKLVLFTFRVLRPHALASRADVSRLDLPAFRAERSPGDENRAVQLNTAEAVLAADSVPLVQNGVPPERMRA